MADLNHASRRLVVALTLITLSLTLFVRHAHSAAADTTELPIYDTHVHYSLNSQAEYKPNQIIAKLVRANVARAVVSSSPDDGTRMLYKEDPNRIVPFLRPYHDEVNSGNWYNVAAIPAYLESRLTTPIYQGIGEFHLQSVAAANLPVVRKTARMAVERGLYLQVHADASAIRAIFAYEPKAKIFWAHAGMTDQPETVLKMMDEFPNLWIDTSYRESDIAPGGKLSLRWRTLFLKYPDRITIGSDTWVPARWDDYEQRAKFNRDWLNQLPREVAEKIAYRNAVKLLGAGANKQLE